MALCPNYKERAAKLFESCDKYQQQLMGLFDELEVFDPELAQLLIDTLECRQPAANFMFRTHSALGEITLYQALADSRRDEVIELLSRINHGVY